MGNQYSTREVSKLLKVPERNIRQYAQAGLLGKNADPSLKTGRYRFDFRDVMVLKMASKLLDEGVASARIQRVLQRLRNHMPSGEPLSGIQVVADNDRILVKNQGQLWEPESGQTVMTFDNEVAILSGEVAELEMSGPGPDSAAVAGDDLDGSDDFESAGAWFEVGCAVEESEPQKAYEAYLRALACNPEHVEAYINIGSLCSAAGEPMRAAAYFRLAIRISDAQPVAHYNLAVTLHDMEDLDGAVASYQKALEHDPKFADAHFNLASVYEKQGLREKALEHLDTYENLFDQSDNP